jgi:hypothetical protein
MNAVNKNTFMSLRINIVNEETEFAMAVSASVIMIIFLNLCQF